MGLCARFRLNEYLGIPLGSDFVSANQFAKLCPGFNLRPAESVWFSRWIDRFASHQRTSRDLPITVTTEVVIQFLRSLRDNDVATWQRLQAARAIECYRSMILKSEQPSLDPICRKLEQMASSEKRAGGALPAAKTAEILEHVDSSAADCLRKVQAELRLLHYSLDTEKAYLGWIKRFMKYCQSEDLEQFDEKQIKEFLTDLATVYDVAASTQSQALSALMFLYQKVYNRRLEFIDALRAKKPRKLPTVLNRAEIATLYELCHGRYKLLFQLLYGAGLRHREALRLRIKDICFDEGHLVIREAKGSSWVARSAGSGSFDA